MAKDKKKKKKKVHATYNNKMFLAPDSITSMSAIHTKIYKDGTAIIRLSDCYGSIKIWNDLNTQSQIKEMLSKIDNMQVMLTAFRKEVAIKSPDLLP